MLSLPSTGGVSGVFVWLHLAPYAHLPHVSHCKSFDPMDCWSLSPGWVGSHEKYLAASVSVLCVFAPLPPAVAPVVRSPVGGSELE